MTHPTTPHPQEDPDRDYGKKARRRDAEQVRRAQRSGFVQELVQEIEGAPEEVRGSLLRVMLAVTTVTGGVSVLLPHGSHACLCTAEPEPGLCSCKRLQSAT